MATTLIQQVKLKLWKLFLDAFYYYLLQNFRNLCLSPRYSSLHLLFLNSILPHVSYILCLGQDYSSQMITHYHEFPTQAVFIHATEIILKPLMTFHHALDSPRSPAIHVYNLFTVSNACSFSATLASCNLSA